MYSAEIIVVPIPEKYNNTSSRNEINIIQQILSHRINCLELEPPELIPTIQEMVEDYTSYGIAWGDIILFRNEVAIIYLEHILDFVESTSEIEYGIKVLFEPYSNNTINIIWS